MNLVKELVFHIIEHGILSDDFANDHDFKFQVLFCDLDIESLHGKIFVMYFSHCNSLTSYIRGNLLYYEMTLIRRSTDTKCVGTQKDNVD